MIKDEHISFYRPGKSLQAGALLLLCLLSFCACAPYQQPPRRKHYTEAQAQQAEWLKRNGNPAGALHYMDSLYATFPYISIADKYQYYYFRSGISSHLKATEQTDLAAQSKLNYIDSMLWVIEANDQTTEMAREYANAFRLKGGFFLAHNYYTAAYTYLSKGRLLSRHNGDSCAAGQYAGILAFIFYRQGRFDEAVDNYKDALLSASFCNDTNLQSYQQQTNLSNLALSYTRLGQTDSALKYYDQTIACLERQKTIPGKDLQFLETALGIAYGNMAQAYQLKGDSSNALKWYLESIRINDRKGYDNKDATVTKLHLADLYLDIGKSRQARALLDEVAKVLPVNDPETKMTWLKLTWKLAQKEHLDREPLIALQYYQFKDSLRESNKNLISTDLLQAFMKEEKQYEINLLKKDSRIQYLYLMITTIAGGLLAIISLIILRNLRRSKKMEQKTSMLNKELAQWEQQLQQLLIEQEASKNQKRREELFIQETRLQMEYKALIVEQRKKISEDMHDDLSGSLAGLKFYINDCTRKADTVQSQKILADVAAEIGAIYENARAYLHNLRAGEYSQQYNLTQFLTEVSRKFSQNTSLNISLDIDEVKMEALLSAKQHELIYHIVKEGIYNTIRHSGATQVHISLQFTEEECHFSIADNGKGFDRQNNIPGLGLQSISSRIKLLKGTVSIKNAVEGGTVLEGTFPIYWYPD